MNNNLPNWSGGSINAMDQEPIQVSRQGLLFIGQTGMVYVQLAVPST